MFERTKQKYYMGTDAELCMLVREIHVICSKYLCACVMMYLVLSMVTGMCEGRIKRKREREGRQDRKRPKKQHINIHKHT